MRPVSVAFACLLLTACATRWVNPKNPGADLQADEATCQREAERMVKLEDMRSSGGTDTCMHGPNCAGQAQVRELQKINVVLAMKKNCMAGKGWRRE